LGIIRSKFLIFSSKASTICTANSASISLMGCGTKLMEKQQSLRAEDCFEHD
jgi:hypothetical protein